MLYVLNSAILPLTPGRTYTIKAREITIQEAKDLLHKEQYQSAVGHESTARLMTNIFGVEIPYQRIQIRLTSGDEVITMLLKKRLDEGVVIRDERELQAIGYELWYFRIE